MKGKTVAHSRAVMSQVMLPSQANPTGNVHGGEIMKLMDTTAYVVAARHARTSIVTARVDELLFHTPIFVGALVTCRAELGFVGRTSMEIHVRVEAEYLEQEKAPETALTALFTMVALDKNGVPCPVPPLILSTPEEQECKDIFELVHKRRRNSSTIFCSQFRQEGWYEQLGGNSSTVADAILDRIVHDAYKINIESIDPSKDISMREVYGLDKTLSE